LFHQRVGHPALPEWLIIQLWLILKDNGEQPSNLVVTRPISLEEFEDFSQLCVVVNIVKVMPGTNLLLSTVTVEDGVIRLFRDWLRNQAKYSESMRSPGAPPQGESSNNIACSSIDEAHCRMLWVGQTKNVGLKVRIRGEEYLNCHFPDLIRYDEEQSTSYKLVIEGTSMLHIRVTNIPLLSHILAPRVTYSNNSAPHDNGEVIGAAILPQGYDIY
jgi:hypothetical protein